MFCRKCGKEIPDDSSFCPKCGAAVDTEERASETPIGEPSGSISDADKKMLEILHRDLEEAKKKQEQDKNNVLLSFYSTDSLRPVCEQIKKIDNNDFAANDSLVSSFCQRLDRSDFRNGFDKAIDCARLALAACPEHKRESLAKKYYEELLEKIAGIFDRLENEYYSTSARSLFGASDRSRYENENAGRDIEVFKSLCELSRIPYLTKSFIDKYTDVILKIYKGAGTYMHVVRGITQFTPYNIYYKEELHKNYPQYY